MVLALFLITLVVTGAVWLARRSEPLAYAAAVRLVLEFVAIMALVQLVAGPTIAGWL
jgi:hypothetical protein